MAKKNKKKAGKGRSKAVIKKPVLKAAAKTGVVPLADRVLVKPFTEEEASGLNKSSFGIVLPDEIGKEKSGQGKVIAVGEGKYVEGKLIPVHVNVGDVVFFSKYSYDEVKYNGEEFYLLKEENVLAVIK